MTHIHPTQLNRAKLSRRTFIGTGMAAGLSSGLAVPALADDSKKLDAQTQVDDSASVVRNMRQGEHASRINFLLSKSYGAMIFPNLIKGGFIFGAEGGNGVLLGRKDLSSNFSSPAFYSNVAASFGFQIGVQSIRAIILITDIEVLYETLNYGLELGADVSAAIGEEGVDQEFSSSNVLNDVYYYAETKAGLYAGVNLEGSGFFTRKSWNKAYYGTSEAKPSKIVLDRVYTNEGAAALTTSLSQSATT